MKEELRLYSFGEILGKSFNLYFSNFIQIVLISVLAYLPLAIVVATFVLAFPILGSFDDNLDPKEGIQFVIASSAFLLLFVVSSVYVSIYIVQLTSKRYLDEQVHIKQLALSSFRFIIPAIIMTFIQYLIIILGILPLFIPSVFFYLCYFITTQTLVIERTGIFAALKRSWRLTKGSRWQILGLHLVLQIGISVVNQVLSLVMVLVGLVISQGNQEVAMVFTLILFYVSFAFMMPLSFCLQVVVYYNQRVKNEAFNIEYLAQQFK